MFAHGPSFGRNPKRSPDFLECPIPKPYRQAALSWYWGFEVTGCRTLRLQAVSCAGLRMHLYPRAPGHVWPGHLHGAGGLGTRAMNTGCPTGWFFVVLPPCPMSAHPNPWCVVRAGFAMGGVGLVASCVRGIIGSVFHTVPCLLRAVTHGCVTW